MEYVRLGHTGLEVSRICLGCMSYGIAERGNHSWTLDEEASRPFIKRALEGGINFFDTANVYSDGTSEEIVGRALGDFATRDEVVIATKVHGRMRPGPNGAGLSRRAILSEIDASLRRLGTDYVDLYQIHRYDEETPSRRRSKRCTTWYEPVKRATSVLHQCTPGNSRERSRSPNVTAGRVS